VASVAGKSNGEPEMIEKAKTRTKYLQTNAAKSWWQSWDENRPAVRKALYFPHSNQWEEP